jgi:hypothetical protein
VDYNSGKSPCGGNYRETTRDNFLLAAAQLAKRHQGKVVRVAGADLPAPPLPRNPCRDVNPRPCLPNVTIRRLSLVIEMRRRAGQTRPCMIITRHFLSLQATPTD